MIPQWCKGGAECGREYGRRSGFAMADDPVAEAHASLVQAIAELRLMQVPVPVSLHRAVHSLRYTLDDRRETEGEVVVVLRPRTRT
jgi:hypothetical protein